MTRTADRETFLAIIITTAVEGPYGVTTWAEVTDYGWCDPSLGPGSLEPSPAGGGNARVEILHASDDPKSGSYVVDLDAIARGLRVFRKEQPDWYRRSFAGEEPDFDQIDADAVLQCSVLGEVVYS